VKLSVVIPAHNESEVIRGTLEDLVAALDEAEIDHEVLVIDDASTDATRAVVDEVATRHPTVRCRPSPFERHGFGFAVRAGLDEFAGDAVAVVMADGSDHPRDVVAYHRLLEQGFDCAFGSRFLPGSEVHDYPWFKLILNRIVNTGIRFLFRHGYNDTTNAFKAYRREVIESVQPLLAHHFNLTAELPLKAIVRGHSYAVIPISWANRQAGESKLYLQEMGSRYLFIILYIFLEHHLSRGDYHREGPQRAARRLSPTRPGEAVGGKR
jgi:dolichol-phosphate mannosyltransferase